MQFEDIALALADGIGTISLSRSDKGNTVRSQTMHELCMAIDQFTADTNCAVIVLRGEGKHFSTGADFTFLDELTRTPTVDIRSQIYVHFQGAVRRFYHCPKPTVALVQGAAITVGCELAAAADFRLASDDSFFQESWIKLGIMPPLGGTFLLPRLIGLGRASEMVLTARTIRATEAYAIGLISEVVAPDALQARGTEFAHELKLIAPLAYRAVKEALHRGLETDMEIEWSANLSTQAVLLGSEDFKEGLAAVKARRAPKFSGR
jgi:enoyl-CoA hydratase/carnithine racemase